MKKELLIAGSILFSITMHAQNSTTDTLDKYTFIMPGGWSAQKGNGYIIYTKQYDTDLACNLTIIAPQASSGNLRTDVKAVFDQMYPGWRFYYSDQRHDELKKGFTVQGLEYWHMEAFMVRDRQGGGWDYQTGDAIVVGMGKQIAIIAMRHESTGLHCQCKLKYENWTRFFYNFNIKGFPASVNTTDVSKKIIGSWMTSSGATLNEFVFAANGHYQNITGYGSTTEISNDKIELKSSVFQGDGTYTITNGRIVMKRKGSNKTQSYRFRMEKFNKGSTGWQDRLYLLNEKPLDGGSPYEVIYERSIR